jgi:hypothetical protein
MPQKSISVQGVSLTTGAPVPDEEFGWIPRNLQRK